MNGDAGVADTEAMSFASQRLLGATDATLKGSRSQVRKNTARCESRSGRNVFGIES